MRKDLLSQWETGASFWGSGSLEWPWLWTESCSDSPEKHSEKICPEFLYKFTARMLVDYRENVRGPGINRYCGLIRTICCLLGNGISRAWGTVATCDMWQMCTHTPRKTDHSAQFETNMIRAGTLALGFMESNYGFAEATETPETTCESVLVLSCHLQSTFPKRRTS